MASQRDKDYHKLRNPEKYDLVPQGLHWYLSKYGRMMPKQCTKEEREVIDRYDKIYSKYGCDPWVGNKRRRNSTRKSNQKNKQRAHKIERAKHKEQVRAEVTQETN
jgi:hypothetical protein